MASVLEIEGLTKTYRSRKRGVRTAVDGFDMHVEAGQVHGFLGPNGSGKTTTLRTLLGLVRADAGRMAILGQPVPAALPAVAQRVGAIVETPVFFPNFSARDTLSLLATAGDVPQRRVAEVLELVGLRDRAKDRVRSYSLGMKQRLALASALLKQPDLLILDEPANGLDPGGIRQMRALLRDLAAAGTTVVLSSHILSEVQLICDSVTIISLGRRVTAGPVNEVLAQHSDGGLRVRLEPGTDLTHAVATLAHYGMRASRAEDHLLVQAEEPAAVVRALSGHDLNVVEVAPVVADLESVFLRLTGTAAEPGRSRQVDQSVRVGAGASGQGWGE
jgi:ABC-2 type transport system ATP-binding protein